ncbi:sensor histidine kinase [Parendozoicomonas haliclonae]|uniref:sensor histidine kinase n=1 Tax=Parendozoicomonas haliclonae TaxID=1960125 RepID=UPI001A99DB8D|nr:histidine kinase [Parendozoicomonas haliclonae]
MLVIVAELFVLVLVLAWTGAGVFDWNRLALTSLFVQWIVLSSAAVICTLRPLLYKAGTATAAIASLAVTLSMTSLFTLLSSWVLGNLDSGIQEPNFWQGPWGNLLRNNLIALIISTIVLRYFYLQNELSRQQQAELNSRIQSLQSRIQPHFLFNSMNTIASLIATRPEVAEQVVEDLSDLFRASLDKASILISVDEELELARQYMNIESLRFGERIETVWDLPSLPIEANIPRLCLQPVLENAVYHGIQPVPEGGTITITVKQEDESIEFVVCNTLPESANTETSEKGNQIAQKNIADRLNAIYGEDAYLQTSTFQREGRRWYKTVIHCPLKQP